MQTRLYFVGHQFFRFTAAIHFSLLAGKRLKDFLRDSLLDLFLQFTIQVCGMALRYRYSFVIKYVTYYDHRQF